MAELDEVDSKRRGEARNALIGDWQQFRLDLQCEARRRMSRLTRFKIQHLAGSVAGFVHAVTPFSEKGLVRYLLSTRAFQVHAKSTERSLEREAAKLQYIEGISNTA